MGRQGFSFGAVAADGSTLPTHQLPRLDFVPNGGTMKENAKHTPDEQECIYCGAMIPIADGEALPMDSSEWARLAEQHGTGCPWIETKAYQIAEGR